MRNKIYNDGLSKWQRYRIRLKEKGISNKHNKKVVITNKKERKNDIERKRDYRKTPRGRALCLISGYKRADKRHERGKCTLTAEWIIENIFNSKCYYCGETDWLKLGADRIDNSKPHTPDNVVCSCWNCNNKRQKMSFDDFKKKMGLTSPS